MTIRLPAKSLSTNEEEAEAMVADGLKDAQQDIVENPATVLWVRVSVKHHGPKDILEILTYTIPDKELLLAAYQLAFQYLRSGFEAEFGVPEEAGPKPTSH